MSSQIFSDTTPITSTKQLVEHLADGGKSADRWVVGTEHEKIGWRVDAERYPSYEETHGIGWLLGAFEAQGWESTREGQHIVALAKDGATITLEPGGQLELSGAPLRLLADGEIELDAHLEQTAALSEEAGLIWAGLGVVPVGGPNQMPRMPKARYGIMRRYLPTKGDLALRMMHQTCTVQANYDFADERDAFRKLRASLYVQPLVLAAFANSGVVDGQISEYRSYRGHIWEHTDDDRFVYPRALLEEGTTFAEYVEWVIDVPMFLIYRDGRYVDCAGLSFRDFMARGFEGHTAIMADFALHLSTIFPDARVKQHLEVRAADMGDRAHVLALPALHAGLLYDTQALQGVLDRFSDWSYEDVWALRRAVPTEGLNAWARKAPVVELWRDVLRIAREGLSRWEPGAERFLDVLDQGAAECLSPIDRLAPQWTGDTTAFMRAARIC